MNPCNPLAVEARRIGDSTTVIVLFAGQRVPNYVKYGSILVRCGLYRKYFDICRQCGRIGHRRDICPNTNTRICFGCGIANTSEGHESECKPRCKLCGGQQPTGEKACNYRHKTPYVVKKRQWERNKIAQQQLDPESFPPLREPPLETPRRESRQRANSRQRAISQRDRSVRHRRPSRSKKRVAWADAVKANAPTKGQPPKSTTAKEETGIMKALRDENERLKQKFAAQDASIKKINEKLTTLLAMQQ